MRHKDDLPMSLSLACAIIGTGFVAVFVLGNSAHASLMSAAAVAAGIGVLLLACGLVVARPRNVGTCAGTCSASEPGGSRKRREVLEFRLHVDPPRVCSQHAVACTCWSMCGSVPPEDRQGRKLVQYDLPLSVRRIGKDDCPFRFRGSR